MTTSHDPGEPSSSGGSTGAASPRHPRPDDAKAELPPPVAAASAPPALPAGDSWIVPTRPYRSGSSLATVVRVLLVAAIVATGFDAAANVDAAHLVGLLEADTNAVSLAEIDASDLRTGMAGLLQVGLMTVAFGFLIAWTSRLYRNLGALGVGPLRYAEGWAIGAWFIPFFNLVRPKQILDDLWRGSGPADGEHWRDRAVTPLLHWWWGLWILAAVLWRSSASEPADLGAAQSAAVREVAGDVVFVVAAVVAIVAITRITDRQERTAGRADAGRRNRWVPAALLSSLLGIAVFGVSLAAFAAVDGEETAISVEASSARADVTSEPVGRNRRTVLAMDLRAGDCIADPDSSMPEETTTVLAVDVVDCATPHDTEVIALVVHPADEQADYPGEDALIEHANDACVDRFVSWVGLSYAESALEMIYMWPLSSGWARGDRTIICIASLPDGERLEGTVRDSGR